MKRSCLSVAIAGLVLGLAAPVASAAVTTPADQREIRPDREWTDTDGDRINAHSGDVLEHDGVYYWYGTHKIPGTDERRGRTDLGVHVYRSRDLVNWEDMGLALTAADAPDTRGAKIQRAKVAHNPHTGEFVLMFKLYLRGDGIKRSHVGVATSDTPAGPFTYRNRFLGVAPNGTGDHELWQDADGDLHHIAVQRDGTRELAVARMRDNYLEPATAYRRMRGIRPNTEGLALSRRGGVFHLVGSGSSGWDPTAPRYYTSRSLEGPWAAQPNPLRGRNSITGMGTQRSFGGQSSNSVHIGGNRYALMMDVHQPRNPYDSRYIWLPLRIEDGQAVVRWRDRWVPGA